MKSRASVRAARAVRRARGRGRLCVAEGNRESRGPKRVPRLRRTRRRRHSIVPRNQERAARVCRRRPGRTTASRVDALIAGAREPHGAQARVPRSQTEIDPPSRISRTSSRWIAARAITSAAASGCWPRTWCSPDGIEKMDGAVSAIERARLGESSAMQEIIGTRRREQLLTAGGAAALAVMIAFMLVPLPKVETAASAAAEASATQARAGAAFDCSTAGIGETDAALDGSRARTGSQRRTCSYLFSAKTFRSRGRSGRDRCTVQRSHA